MKIQAKLERVAKMTMAGATVQETAQALAINVHSVKQYRKLIYLRMGVCSAAGLRRKLNWAPPVSGESLQQDYIELRRQGLSCKEIALRYGISHKHVKTFTCGKV